MNTYASPHQIGLGDSVNYNFKNYLVLINYIKGETDAKGYTPESNRTILIDDNADVSIREVTLGGAPIEEFVSYHPTIGASDDELTKICDDIYQTLMGAFVAQMMEIA